MDIWLPRADSDTLVVGRELDEALVNGYYSESLSKVLKLYILCY
jgi:hypothetical protein